MNSAIVTPELSQAELAPPAIIKSPPTSTALTEYRGEHHLEQIFPGVYLVPRGIELRVDLGALLFDFDGTIAETEELLYGGPESCYAYVIKKILSDSGHAQTAYAHLSSRNEEFPRFDPEGWSEEWEKREFRKCKGGGLDNDAFKFVDKIKEEYGIEITWAEFKDMYNQSSQEHLRSILHKIELVPNINEFFKRLQKAGVVLGICSAAPGENIIGIAQRHGIDQFFRVVHANAQKKLPNGAYSGNGAAEAHESLKVPSQACGLIGDTCSDVGTGALGGLRLVVIRVPEDSKENRDKLISEIQSKLIDEQGFNFGPNTCEVMLVHDYEQIRIVSSEIPREMDRPVKWSANRAEETTGIDFANRTDSTALPTFPPNWAQDAGIPN